MSQSIEGNFQDVDTPNANSIVKVVAFGSGGGTGTMVTPLLGLTACHVVMNGTTMATGINVEVGVTPSVAPADRAGPGGDIIVASMSCNVPSSDGERRALDWAAFRLNPQMAESSWRELLEIEYHKPSFETPPTTPVLTPVVLENSFIAGYAAGFREMAPVTTAVTRSEHPFGAYWSFDEGPVSEDGDSGGPLFRLVNGRREVFGTLRGKTCNKPEGVDCNHASASNRVMRYSDLTVPSTRETLFAHFRALRSSNWKTRHGLSPTYDYWLGEVEYSGACDTVHDPDCDHWYNTVPSGLPGAGSSHDNCPNFNPLQVDSNDNGIGDACECPYDNETGYIDIDADGLCAKGPNGEVVDNCPTVPNPDQANCNKFSEEVLGKQVLGDACDPIPCPRVTAIGGDIIGGTEGCYPNHWTPTTGQVCMWEEIRDTIVVEPVGASRLGGAAGQQLTAVVPNVNTSMHFCPPLDPNGDDIDCRHEAVIRDVVLTFDRLPGPEYVVDGLRPWLPASRRVGSPALPSYVEHFSMDYGASVEQVRWAFARDAQHWSARGWLPVAPDSDCLNPLIAGQCLVGRFGFHANTLVGHTQNTVNGVFVGARNDGADLANHFINVAPHQFHFDHTPGVGLLEDRLYKRPLLFTLPYPPYWRDRWRYNPEDALVLAVHGSTPLLARVGESFEAAAPYISPGLRALLETYSSGPSATSQVRWIAPTTSQSVVSHDTAVIATKGTGSSWNYLSVRSTDGGGFALASELGQLNRFVSSPLPPGELFFDKDGSRLTGVNEQGVITSRGERTPGFQTRSVIVPPPRLFQFTFGVLQSATAIDNMVVAAYTMSSKPIIGNNITHSLVVSSVDLSQSGSEAVRMTSFSFKAPPGSRNDRAYVVAENVFGRKSILLVHNDFVKNEHSVYRLIFGLEVANHLGTFDHTVLSQPVLDSRGLHMLLSSGISTMHARAGAQRSSTQAEGEPSTLPLSALEVEGEAVTGEIEW